MVRALRQAVAQTTVPEDPTDAGILGESGAEIRTLLRDARTSGARLAQFPERGNRLPGQVRDVLGRAGHAGGSRPDTSRLGHHGRRGRGDRRPRQRTGLWTAFGSLHPLTPPNRPHNSLYIISPNGHVVTRYDKRFLSHTEVTWMYTPGTEPVVFAAEGRTTSPGSARLAPGPGLPVASKATETAPRPGPRYWS